MTTKATARPSGETAGVWSIAAPGGAAIDNASVDISAAGRRAHSDQARGSGRRHNDERTPSPHVTGRNPRRAGASGDVATRFAPPSQPLRARMRGRGRTGSDGVASFSRHRRISALIAGGILPGALDRSGGSWLRMAVIVSAGVAPWKAGLPVSIS